TENDRLHPRSRLHERDFWWVKYCLLPRYTPQYPVRGSQHCDTCCTRVRPEENQFAARPGHSRQFDENRDDFIDGKVLEYTEVVYPVEAAIRERKRENVCFPNGR